MISICFNLVNSCILAKIHSCRQGFIITFPKTISSTLTILEIPMPTVYPIVLTVDENRDTYLGSAVLAKSYARASQEVFVQRNSPIKCTVIDPPSQR